MKANGYEEQLIQLISQSEFMMTILRTVRHCNPPDWLVGAGLIRNLVWDYLHRYSQPTPPRVSQAQFQQRLRDKQIQQKWPQVQIING